MPKNIKLKIQALAKIMAYILGHRPDEFGLVPDSQGFVMIKELVQVLHEEEGWRHVRNSHINEVLLSPERRLFDWEENRIRAVDRKWFIAPLPSAPLETKIYHTAIRRKAHRHVMEHGLQAAKDKFVILSPEQDMALRIGKRRDPKPVLLQVMVHKAFERGMDSWALGSLLLSRHIGPQFLMGPPVEEDDQRSKRRSEERPSQFHQAMEAGTFLLDMEKIYPGAKGKKRIKGRKPKGWKEEVRRMRRRGK